MATTRPEDDPTMLPVGLGARARMSAPGQTSQPVGLGASARGQAVVPYLMDRYGAGSGRDIPAAAPATMSPLQNRRPLLDLSPSPAPAAPAGALGLGRRAMNDFDRTPVDMPAGRNLSYDFGTTTPSPAGLGRGVLNPPRASQGPGFTQELGAVPRELPTGMRDGTIYKTTDPATGRVTYSGRNVSGDAPMVDGLGNQVAQRGSVNVIGGGGTGSGAYADRQLSAARAAALARGDTDAVAASYGQGPTAPRGFVVGAEGGFGIRRDPRIASDARLGARRVQQAFGQDPASQRLAMEQRESLGRQAQREGELRLRGQELTDRRAERQPSIMDRLRLQTAQDAYQSALASGDQQQIRQAELALRAVSGQLESPESWRGVELSGGTQVDGTRNPSSLAAVNQRTGEVRLGAGGSAGPAAVLPPGMTRQIGTSGGRPVYEDAKGNRFVAG